MTVDLPKGHSIVTLGLAAISGVGVGLAFTVLDIVSTWFAIMVAVIALGMPPLLAGWLLPGLKHVALFPISVLVSLSIVSVIHNPVSYDITLIGFVVIRTIVYGGAACVVFAVGWIARQHLHRLRGFRFPGH